MTMMPVPLFQVDAFTDGPFTGNPAAVCVIDEWPTDTLMQKIAAENNLAETAFILYDGNNFRIRWFTPVVEVDLCGHATLASAYVVLNILHPKREKVVFHSMKMGNLTVRKSDDMLVLDFPADKVIPCELPDLVKDSLNVKPIECWKGRSDYLILLRNQTEILDARPDFRKLASFDGRGIIITAPGDDVDFVSRFFAPRAGIDEDPVTGSAHTSLTPFWSSRLGKTSMKARQLSIRGGYLECTLKDDRILIAGRASLYLKGEIYT